MDAELGAIPFATVDLSGLARVASLVMLPFAHEDLAILAGAYAVVNNLMPVSLVVASIYGGIIASDFALYGIGAGARHLPWLNRFALDRRAQGFADVLKRNIFGLVLLCRFVPGVVFFAFIACGWSRVSLTRFTLASLLISALYLPLVLYLVIVFGDALDDHVGLWSWPFLFAALAGASFVRKRVFGFRDADNTSAPQPAADGPMATGFSGMPSLADLTRKVAPAERIPPLLFYLPLVLNWIALGLRHRSLTLPSACNPAIPTGGMWGESKSDCLALVADGDRAFVADYVVLQRSASGDADGACDLERALTLLADAGIPFPLIAKPDIGWHGRGVRRIDNITGLRAYLAAYPRGERIIFQRYVEHVGEAAVLYARLPGAPRGGIVSLGFRYFPHVVGDGRSTLCDLVQRDPRARWKSRLHFGFDGSHEGLVCRRPGWVPDAGELVQIACIGNQRAGGLYRDGHRYVTARLAERFDAIARNMPDFHYGRFDIRFADTDALMRGEGFSIVEINGIGGEAIDVWDPQLPIGEVYRRLRLQQRLLFAIGDRNRARGVTPMPAGAFLAHLVRQTRLLRRYPTSS